MNWWVVAAAANLVILATCLAISLTARRSRPRAAVEGEDAGMRKQRALEIQDNVVQELTTAKLALEVGDQARGMRSIEKTLKASRKMITDLLRDGTDTNDPLRPGELRRTHPAGG